MKIITCVGLLIFFIFIIEEKVLSDPENRTFLQKTKTAIGSFVIPVSSSVIGTLIAVQFSPYTKANIHKNKICGILGSIIGSAGSVFIVRHCCFKQGNKWAQSAGALLLPSILLLINGK